MSAASVTPRRKVKTGPAGGSSTSSQDRLRDTSTPTGAATTTAAQNGFDASALVTRPGDIGHVRMLQLLRSARLRAQLEDASLKPSRSSEITAAADAKGSAGSQRGGDSGSSSGSTRTGGGAVPRRRASLFDHLVKQDQQRNAAAAPTRRQAAGNSSRPSSNLAGDAARPRTGGDQDALDPNGDGDGASTRTKLTLDNTRVLIAPVTPQTREAARRLATSYRPVAGTVTPDGTLPPIDGRVKPATVLPVGVLDEVVTSKTKKTQGATGRTAKEILETVIVLWSNGRVKPTAASSPSLNAAGADAGSTGDASADGEPPAPAVVEPPPPPPPPVYSRRTGALPPRLPGGTLLPRFLRMKPPLAVQPTTGDPGLETPRHAQSRRPSREPSTRVSSPTQPRVPGHRTSLTAAAVPRRESAAVTPPSIPGISIFVDPDTSDSSSASGPMILVDDAEAPSRPHVPASAIGPARPLLAREKSATAAAALRRQSMVRPRTAMARPSPPKEPESAGVAAPPELRLAAEREGPGLSLIVPNLASPMCSIGSQLNLVSSPSGDDDAVRDLTSTPGPSSLATPDSAGPRARSSSSQRSATPSTPGSGKKSAGSGRVRIAGLPASEYLILTSRAVNLVGRTSYYAHHRRRRRFKYLLSDLATPKRKADLRAVADLSSRLAKLGSPIDPDKLARALAPPDDVLKPTMEKRRKSTIYDRAASSRAHGRRGSNGANGGTAAGDRTAALLRFHPSDYFQTAFHSPLASARYRRGASAGGGISSTPSSAGSYRSNAYAGVKPRVAASWTHRERQTLRQRRKMMQQHAHERRESSFATAVARIEAGHNPDVVVPASPAARDHADRPGRAPSPKRIVIGDQRTVPTQTRHRSARMAQPLKVNVARHSYDVVDVIEQRAAAAANFWFPGTVLDGLL
ncbi:hypothetical protein H9P43_003212 [Blastocladiella emersonii ATCC 22665]|nr:hypothetical protein H9P43_003212 [Blastocladiella emersonii ATCC 22665]